MLQPSEEANERQLRVARAQGDALRGALDAMREETGHAEQIRSGDYIVGYAAEKAEGLYIWRDGRLEWTAPDQENVHIEIVVADAEDGRFVPGVEVTVTLTTEDGEEIGTHRHPLLWHPWLFHYGRNWQVPHGVPYELIARVSAMTLARHDKKNGSRFSTPVEVRFSNVRFETGQK